MKDLNKKTCKELREIAKQFGIVGRWDMTKPQLVEAISKASDLTDDEIEFESDCIIKESNQIQCEGSQKLLKTTQDYLDAIEPGTLVAFKRNKNKDVAMSGKYIGVEKGKIVVESKKGTRYTLNPENIIWVKTGTRWPKWVFSLFNRVTEGSNDYAVS